MNRIILPLPASPCLTAALRKPAALATICTLPYGWQVRLGAVTIKNDQVRRLAVLSDKITQWDEENGLSLVTLADEIYFE